jgi:hypothetical protein
MAGDKSQSKEKKAEKPADAKPKAAKGEKPKSNKPVAEAEVSEKKVAKVEPPRPPADPRLKVLKKFEGRFLPRGPLRDRYKAILSRWSAGDDHGGVTVDELKTLLTDWRASREKKTTSSAK